MPSATLLNRLHRLERRYDGPPPPAAWAIALDRPGPARRRNDNRTRKRIQGLLSVMADRRRQGETETLAALCAAVGAARQAAVRRR